MPPTIVDVARLARVSPATVSRVLNGATNVREPTRAAVERAIKELNYEPSVFGITLLRKTWQRLNLLVPNLGEPFYGFLAQEIEVQARHSGYQVTVVNTALDAEWQAHFLLGARRRATDGFICASPTIPGEYLTEASARVPVVCVDRSLPGWDIPSVEIDNVQGAYTAVKHLIDRGHREIAYIGLATGRQQGLDRLQGYRTALRDAGIDPSPRWEWIGPEPQQYSYSATRPTTVSRSANTVGRQLDAGNRPTAIMAISDTTAIGALHAVTERGLRVPEDIALVGFDDLYFSAYLSPPLTSVAQPMEQMAATAVDMVIALIEGRELPERHVVLPTELRVRRSSDLYCPRVG